MTNKSDGLSGNNAARTRAKKQSPWLSRVLG